MDFKRKVGEVVGIISRYLSKEISLRELNDYAWGIIDKFPECKAEQADVDEARAFWFAIWQIQHLANEEHMKDGTLERELRTVLKYLSHQIPLPSGAYGLPPGTRKKKV